MVLTGELKLLEPLVADLRIVNLVPFDNDETWDNETTAVLEKFFNEKKNQGSMICKVSLTVQSTIFSETFEIRQRAEKVNIDVVKYSLKKDLLKKDFCSEVGDVCEKLKCLVRRAGLYVADDNLNIAKNPVESSSFTGESSKEIKADPRWKQLSTGGNHQVNLKHFENPEMFYVRLVDSGNHVLGNLMKTVENCNERRELKEFEEGKLCMVVEGEKTQRAVITKENPLTVFLLDAGEHLKCSRDKIFELPISVVNAAPFQAVQCRMLGVKPKFGLQEWGQRLSSAFREFMREMSNGKSMKLRVIKVKKNVLGVVMFHPESGERIDKLAVTNKYAEVADEEVPEFADSDEEEFEEITENPDLLKVIKLLKEAPVDDLRTFKDAHTPRVLTAPAETPAHPQTNSEHRKNMKLSVSDDEKLKQQQLPSTLDYIHKQPLIEWRQNGIIIYLVIDAIDSIDYGLRVDDSSLHIYIKYEDRFERTVINFYGTIQPQLVSHVKSGQKIIVRLPKHSSVMCEWPRLGQFNEVNRFIKFSTEAMPEFRDAPNTYNEIDSRPGGNSDTDEQSSELEEDEPVHVPI